MFRACNNYFKTINGTVFLLNGASFTLKEFKGSCFCPQVHLTKNIIRFKESCCKIYRISLTGMENFHSLMLLSEICCLFFKINMMRKLVK